MKEQNDAHRRLREQLDQHKFELPASSWEQMADILDGKQPVPQPRAVEDNRRRKGFWWILFAALLLFGGYTGAQYIQFSGTPPTKLMALPIPMVPQAGATQPLPEPTVQPAVATASIESGTTAEGAASEVAPPPFSGNPTEQTAASTVKQERLTVEYPERKNIQEALSETSVSEPNTVPTATPEPVQALANIPRRTAGLLTIPDGENERLPNPAGAIPNRRFHFGIKAGLDANTQQSTALAGLFARYRLSGKWALQLEPQYKTRSDSRGRGLGLETSSVQNLYYPNYAVSRRQELQITRLHFFELPLTALYQVHPKLQLLGGAQLVYLNNASRRSNTFSSTANSGGFDNPFDSTTQNEERTDNSPGVVNWDAGLILGADYQLSPKLSLDLRYVQGLYDLSYDDFFSNEDDYLNSSVQLSIKWRW